ncbi:hypothetical protein Agabi119p4_5323 [Agaricus bisporus var. burnettii]|uniref:Prokaryotic-type class I peptide chain release factors domain-containing protein n=1 Tax=Agaricus bisporus var. burnettii TaxID=192524 RepID=A0A8H7KGD3_AGABI|nr:hypothetical protein Agabi119p4_5323 [Agaricus bisporus var. burnettii]
MSLVALLRRSVSLKGPAFALCRYSSSLPTPPNLSVLDTPEDTEKARTWISEFEGVSIPRSSVELQFARSSGPGGQNVNKVNTKAVIKCSLNSSWIPVWARSELRQCSYYVASSHCIQVSSTTTRSQAQNVDDCLAKLHATILSAAKALIKNEPSEAQKQKVEKHQKAEKARRKSEKMRRSDVKRGRSNNDWF